MSGPVPLPCGILLAAGHGQRYQRAWARTRAEQGLAGPDATARTCMHGDPTRPPDKLLQPLADGRAVAVAAALALKAVLPRVVAVVRPDAPALAQALAACGVEVLRWPPALASDAHDGATDAPDVSDVPSIGMGASLAAAVRASAGAAGWMVALADMPRLRPDTIRRVAQAISQGVPEGVQGANAIAAPLHQGRRGHPVAFGAAYGPQLVGLTGDQGARDIVAAHARQLRLIEVDDPGVLADVDTPEDLARVFEARTPGA